MLSSNVRPSLDDRILSRRALDACREAASFPTTDLVNRIDGFEWELLSYAGSDHNFATHLIQPIIYGCSAELRRRANAVARGTAPAAWDAG